MVYTIEKLFIKYKLFLFVLYEFIIKSRCDIPVSFLSLIFPSKEF